MAKEIMSIRLSADGLSFWTTEQDGSNENIVDYRIDCDGKSWSESVREAVSEYCGILSSRGQTLPKTKKLYADTLQYVLIPEEWFREEDAEKYLRIHSVEPREEYYTVCSKPIHGTVAVMRLEKEAMEALGGQLGQFEVGHILQYNIERGGLSTGKTPHIRIYLSPLLCHITAHGTGGLVMADSYPMDSATDVIYYLGCIIQSNSLGTNTPLLIDGYKAEEVAGLVARRFKGAQCV